MSVSAFFGAVLALGFMAVGMIGFLGWRARMRQGDLRARWSLRRVVIAAVFPILAGIEFFSCR